jgi:predicted DNA-binding transcriptional regulator YafY
VSAAVLAEELGVSLRTIYRDVATLAAQGAPIEGEAGFGYVLKPGFFLPPLMLEEDEADAVLLGLRLVAQRADSELARKADNALAKIAAVLPAGIEETTRASGLLAAPNPAPRPEITAIRHALQAEEKLRLSYTDKAGRASQRVVWPIALGFFEGAELLAAWCESRRDFRHFRLDRIEIVTSTGERLPTRRRMLLADWRAWEGLLADARGPLTAR